MSNTSATGGYLVPSPVTPLALDTVLQNVFVGLSGISGMLIIQKWQLNPPKRPDLTTNWIELAMGEDDSDTNAYTDVAADGSNIFMRMEALSLQCSFYGPDALAIGQQVRDGFQIPQNLEAIQALGLTFAYSSKLVRAPDIINERWCNRWEMTVSLRQETRRVYPILDVLSAHGTIVAAGLPAKNLDWNTE